MSQAPKRLTVRAPGRVCLFGEHQDYLNLPVITAAIDLHITIKASIRADRRFVINLPDIKQVEHIDLDKPIKYKKSRDYFRSVLNVLRREGVEIPSGYDCEITGNIPINAGTSSSSALVVAWVHLLLAIADHHHAAHPDAIARMAHSAEVLEFKEPGGKMDQTASSFGGVAHIDFAKDVVIALPSKLGTMVLGNSNQRKDTHNVLSRVKVGVRAAISKLRSIDPEISMESLTEETLNRHRSLLNHEQFTLLHANMLNRDLTKEALQQLQHEGFDLNSFGSLMNRHQDQLRDGLRISTAKIDRMIDAALRAGAAGSKINGSGGGGCMFTIGGDDQQRIAAAIAEEGGDPLIVHVSEGSQLGIRG